MNFVPALIVLATISNASEPTDYKTAYQRAMKGEKPLVVLVTAEWCPPCQMMKKTTIPQMVADNKFAGFHFATVDLDRDAKDARNLIGSGKVPQLIVFEKREGKWQSRSMVGYNPPAAVENFLGIDDRLRTASANRLSTDQ